MLFRSKAQKRKMYQLLSEGKISQAVIDEWEKETGNRKLPERIRKKKRVRRGRPRRRKKREVKKRKGGRK